MLNRLDSLIYKAAANRAFTEGAGTSTSDMVKEIKHQIQIKTGLTTKGLTLMMLNKHQPSFVQGKQIIDILHGYDQTITDEQLMFTPSKKAARKFNMTA